MTARIGPEERLQRAVVQYLMLAVDPAQCLWWHVPNGGHRYPATAARMKLMGVRPGVPDLAFILPGGRSGFIELKAGRGTLSDNQKIFRMHALTQGAFWAEARSIADVEHILRGWGVALTASVGG
jgi:hypothetical protein